MFKNAQGGEENRMDNLLIIKVKGVTMIDG